MIHHSAGATVQVAILVIFHCHPKKDSNTFIQQIYDLSPCLAETTSGFMSNVT